MGSVTPGLAVAIVLYTPVVIFDGTITQPIVNADGGEPVMSGLYVDTRPVDELAMLRAVGRPLMPTSRVIVPDTVRFDPGRPARLTMLLTEPCVAMVANAESVAGFQSPQASGTAGAVVGVTVGVAVVGTAVVGASVGVAVVGAAVVLLTAVGALVGADVAASAVVVNVTLALKDVPLGLTGVTERTYVVPGTRFASLYMQSLPPVSRSVAFVCVVVLDASMSTIA